MAVNKYKKHLVVFMEDAPYRSLINGVKISLNVNDSALDVKKPCGGWENVFDVFEDNLFLLENDSCHMLLLIDFDDKKTSSENKFNIRLNKFGNSVPEQHKDRVFLLGVNFKESEALKKEFALTNFENIGKLLVKDCPNSDLKNWQNIHLKCNLPEIDRMKKNGIFEWLFSS